MAAPGVSGRQSKSMRPLMGGHCALLCCHSHPCGPRSKGRCAARRAMISYSKTTGLVLKRRINKRTKPTSCCSVGGSWWWAILSLCNGQMRCWLTSMGEVRWRVSISSGSTHGRNKMGVADTATRRRSTCSTAPQRRRRLQSWPCSQSRPTCAFCPACCAAMTGSRRRWLR